MIGTIWRIRKYIKDAKKGVNEPSNFVFEQLLETALFALIIPGLILAGLLILLGVLGFSHIMSDATRHTIQIFFWIILIFTVITVLGITIVYRGLKKLWRRVARNMGVDDKKLYDINPLQNQDERSH